jgi:hypothetical protein
LGGALGYCSSRLSVEVIPGESNNSISHAFQRWTAESLQIANVFNGLGSGGSWLKMGSGALTNASVLPRSMQYSA